MYKWHTRNYLKSAQSNVYAVIMTSSNILNLPQAMSQRQFRRETGTNQDIKYQFTGNGPTTKAATRANGCVHWGDPIKSKDESSRFSEAPVKNGGKRSENSGNTSRSSLCRLGHIIWSGGDDRSFSPQVD